MVTPFLHRIIVKMNEMSSNFPDFFLKKDGKNGAGYLRLRTITGSFGQRHAPFEQQNRQKKSEIHTL